jgi:hypothetical protein
VNNITLLIAMTVAAISGFFIGSYSGREAKETLATAQIAARHAMDDHEKSVKLLNEQISRLDKEYAAEKKGNSENYQKQKQKWAELLAGRDRKIAELASRNSDTGAEITRLRGTVKDMSPSAERQRTEERIALLEKEFNAQQAQIFGLECSKTPVATEMLSKLKGDTL